MTKRILSLFGTILGALWLASCSTSLGPQSSNLYESSPWSTPDVAAGSTAERASSHDASRVASPQKARPGLGTTWGETTRSQISSSAFERASSSPSGIAKLFYNDEAGAKAMADHSGFRWRSDGRVSSSDGAVTVSLKSGLRTLKGFSARGEEFVVGNSGQKYAIVIRNNTGRRIEIVASVDGLDVMDGRSASFRKRGYILKPNGSLTIKGFRRSTAEVAAFRFSSVADSYANLKHGDTRNVGVIGVAVFREKTSDEVNRRFAADPFATPPN